jgi:asparagine synthase (glutamine-hydrolysing)
MLQDEYKLLFDVFLHESRLARDGILRQEAIDDLLRQHLGGRADHGNRLWLLLNSETWYRMFIEGQSREELSSAIQSGVTRREVSVNRETVCV